MGRTRVGVAAGDRIGMVIALGETPARSAEQIVYRWRCDCGREFERAAANLKAARLANCGCQTGRMIAAARTTHGASIKRRGSPEYATYVCWMSMRWRCENKSRRDFPNYGGRGITVCERWLSFENFLADMGMRPLGQTIDRYPDNDGNYEPGNCRWATPTEQARNKSSNRLIEHAGETLSLCEWAERTGIPRDTLDQRLARWSVAKALTEPLMRRGPQREQRAPP